MFYKSSYHHAIVARLEQDDTKCDVNLNCFLLNLGQQQAMLNTKTKYSNRWYLVQQLQSLQHPSELGIMLLFVLLMHLYRIITISIGEFVLHIML